MIKSVAKRLVKMCNYICKLREKLKYQTRKNYMRGTNNLLVYLVNEYIRNYPEANPSAMDQVDGSIKGKMEGHSLRGVDVVEYYDKTEYYNISTETTVSSSPSGLVANGRFWDGTMDR